MKKLLTLLLALICIKALGQMDTVQISDITISASYTATKSTPFSFKNIDSKTIQLKGREMEPAGLLQSTPSVTYNTDNGTFTGYSYFRLRGIDQTRINVSLNGVPMNEPEDQGIYFNNYVNFLQTIQDVQIIRGAGVSKSGVSSYGGSINFQTIEPEKSKNEIAISGGSFNTFNLTANASCKRGWTRLSYATTDGYKYHSGNKSGSLFYGINLWPKKDLKLFGFVGAHTNEMAWIGSPLDSIKSNRRINANKEWEKDEFLYIHNQLHHNKKFNDHHSLNFLLYHTYLNGWYNMDLGHFDGNFNQAIYKLDLNSNWFGGNVNYNMSYGPITTDLGSSAFTYKRNHNNSINNESYNKNSGIRDEISPYLKATLNLGSTKFYGDIQYRMIDFIYNDPMKYLYRNWNFLNWSVGTTYLTDNNISFYIGVGETHREPTRTDMFGGNDEWIEESFTDITPESVVDYEIGGKYYGDNLNLNLNIYAMEFENEIVLNGQVGPNAIVIHSNVARSFRRGVELDLKYKIGKFELMNVSNLSMNKIIQDSTTITQVLTPSFISSSDVIYHLKNQNFGAALRYNGKSFIDFANEIEIPGYYVLDLYSNVNFHQLSLGVKINNILNKLYYTNGVIGFDGNPGYFQHAGINMLVTLKYTL